MITILQRDINQCNVMMESSSWHSIEAKIETLENLDATYGDEVKIGKVVRDGFDWLSGCDAGDRDMVKKRVAINIDKELARLNTKQNHYEEVSFALVSYAQVWVLRMVQYLQENVW
jgi:hypothetical protein